MILKQIVFVKVDNEGDFSQSTEAKSEPGK